MRLLRIKGELGREAKEKKKLRWWSLRQIAAHDDAASLLGAVDATAAVSGGGPLRLFPRRTRSLFSLFLSSFFLFSLYLSLKLSIAAVLFSVFRFSSGLLPYIHLNNTSHSFVCSSRTRPYNSFVLLKLTPFLTTRLFCSHHAFRQGLFSRCASRRLDGGSRQDLLHVVPI